MDESESTDETSTSPDVPSIDAIPPLIQEILMPEYSSLHRPNLSHVPNVPIDLSPSYIAEPIFSDTGTGINVVPITFPRTRFLYPSFTVPASPPLLPTTATSTTTTTTTSVPTTTSFTRPQTPHTSSSSYPPIPPGTSIGISPTTTTSTSTHPPEPPQPPQPRAPPPATGTTTPHRDRVYKPIRMRVRYTCHGCSGQMDLRRRCTACGHRVCNACAQYPVRRRRRGRSGSAGTSAAGSVVAGSGGSGAVGRRGLLDSPRRRGRIAKMGVRTVFGTVEMDGRVEVGAAAAVEEEWNEKSKGYDDENG